MAETMQFDLVSPERRLSSVQASEVRIPGAEGDLTAMPLHAPTITTLRPGFLRVVGDGGTLEYLVVGGFAEITGSSVSVLAEKAFARDGATKEDLQALLSEAEAHRAEQSGPDRDMADRFVADLVHMLDLMA
ncbi:MAG: F0F1 ATP synthase subunit epsilon [Paracoccaceae bacterium]